MESYLSSIFGLKGRKALITGGTRGIGRALTIALASAGADIILLARNPNSNDVSSLLSEIQSLGRICDVYECDLSDRPKVLSIVPNLIRDNHEIDIFLHSGGLQHRCAAEDFPDTNWDEIIGVNLTAGFQLSRELAKHWLSTSLSNPPFTSSIASRKKIVFIASMTTFVGSTEIPAYTASKGAIGQLTKALNNEWMSKGINVNSIAPGYIATELTKDLQDGTDKEKNIIARVPAGRWGVPEDLAGSVIYLCSRGGDYVGGEVHAVDGGYLGR
ncbi:2-deoxy-D-gluconate 3-dehydrogenase [Tricladium varicosporioides]|nr:2-deoxy-D-gluconate 3-dehydrogenase [Hymenoscyphus varicosporioides]